MGKKRKEKKAKLEALELQRKAETERLDKSMQLLLDKLDETNVKTKDGAEIAGNLARNVKTLQETKMCINNTPEKPRVSPDTWVKAGASVLSVAALLMFEQRGCITSKCLGFISKIKL